MTTASKCTSVRKLLNGYRGNDDPFPIWGRPLFCWEVTGTCTSVIHRGIGSGTQRRTRGDNVGKVHGPAGADSNLRRSAEPDSIKVDWRSMVWRMSPYERRRAGNAAPGSRPEAIHTLRTRRQRGSRFMVDISEVAARDSVPDYECDYTRCRVSGITRSGIGVCASALDPILHPEDSPRIRRPFGPGTMIANRTRENRPSGMTTGACGIVLRGSRIEAQLATAGSATVPYRRMRRRSIQIKCDFTAGSYAEIPQTSESFHAHAAQA
jgi:hypothetical protein